MGQGYLIYHKGNSTIINNSSKRTKTQKGLTYYCPVLIFSTIDVVE
jgi:hypothetical protein